MSTRPLSSEMELHVPRDVTPVAEGHSKIVKHGKKWRDGACCQSHDVLQVQADLIFITRASFPGF